MPYLRFAARRTAQMIPLLFAVLVATFLLLALAPGDPARQVAGLRASEEQLAQVREDLGLDQPLYQQFGRYVGRLGHGDMGETANGSIEVRDLIAENAIPTIWLVATTLVLAIIATIVLSLLAARRPGGWIDKAIQGFTVAGLTMPPFWVGIVLLIVVAAPTGWFPIGGWGDTPAERIRAITLPAITLALVLTPTLVRSFRSSILEVQSSDQVVAARALGIEGWTLTRRYVLRNAAPPTFALLISLGGFLISGMVLVEATFAIPGLGQTMMSGARARDFNIIQGLTLVFAVVVVLLNLIGDLILGALDPRIELR